MLEPDQEREQYPRIERWGSAVAHGSVAFVGIPITLILLNLPWSLLGCPVLSYMIARSFRRRGRVWGAYQGMQASVIQLLLLLCAVTAHLTSGFQVISNVFSFGAFLLFVYSMWAALDTCLGDDFHYIGISKLLGYVSAKNMGRPEVRRRWVTMGQNETDDKGGMPR